MTNKFYDGMLIANITRQISETGRINDPIPVHKLIDAFKAQSAELERLRDVAANKATRCDELWKALDYIVTGFEEAGQAPSWSESTRALLNKDTK